MEQPNEEQEAAEITLEELTHFLQKNKDLITDLVKEWRGHSSQRLIAEVVVIALIMITIGFLVYTGKLSEDALLALGSVIIGYWLKREI